MKFLTGYTLEYLLVYCLKKIMTEELKLRKKGKEEGQ